MRIWSSIYDEYRPISTESEVIATDTDQKEKQREAAYVSRKRMWRTLPEPSSNTLASVLQRRIVIYQQKNTYLVVFL